MLSQLMYIRAYCAAFRQSAEDLRKDGAHPADRALVLELQIEIASAIADLNAAQEALRAAFRKSNSSVVVVDK